MNPYKNKLLESVRDLAERDGLELKTIKISLNSKLSKIVSDFSRKIDKSKKRAENSELKFGLYANFNY